MNTAFKTFSYKQLEYFLSASVKTMVNEIVKLSNVWIYRGFFTRGLVDFVLYGTANSFGWLRCYLLSQRHFRFYNIEKRLFLCFQQNSCFVDFLGKRSWWSLFNKDTKFRYATLKKKDFVKVLNKFSRATIIRKTLGNRFWESLWRVRTCHSWYITSFSENWPSLAPVYSS